MPAAETLRFLLVGEWQAEFHEAAWAKGLERAGHEVIPFRWFEPLHPKGTIPKALARVQNRLLCGPALRRLNDDLLDLARRERPDAVVLYRGTHIFPATLHRLRVQAPAPLLVSYNNDDPFSPRASRMLWRHYLRGLRYTDVNLAYRHKNVRDLERLGAREVRLVRSAFDPDKDRPIDISEEERLAFSSDVVFVGHFEPDGRLEHLRALSESGVDLKLFGPDWSRAPREPWLARFQPIRPLRGDDYVKAIQCAKIALCFLSTLNHDTYTRRCFEIPAIGTMLLCQRTDDMTSMLAPGVEADYFESPAELCAQVARYLADEAKRRAVAGAGHCRVREGGHDVFSRMKSVERIVRDAIARRE